MSVNPYEKLIDLSKLFVGVVEEGTNDGQLIRLFQETVDGRANGEPWCCAFLQFLMKQVDEECFELDPNWAFSKLTKTESCVKLWELSPVACRTDVPKPGFIVVWRHWSLWTKENKWIATSQGHAGLVLSLNLDGTMEVCEGNTSAGPDVEREGDGVYVKTRHQLADTGPMRILGYLDPWLKGE